MGDLRESLLRQELQKELHNAKVLEKGGKINQAGAHYVRAGAIYRRIAYNSPLSHQAKEMFSRATQYESLGNTIRNKKNIREIKELPDLKTEAIESLIITQKPEINWEKIGGLKEAKRVIKEAIILPFIHDKPPFVKSTRTILLYGPPGTGKTLLAKASSNTLDATFFEARLPSLLSKYFGESGKLISALFEKARKLQPSLIFIDELDSIAMVREGSHEATRRVLGQLLQEIEGFNTKKEERVLIMGATNKPWDLDEAIISRFQRKIYVPLPDRAARKSILSIHLEGARVNLSFDELADKTKGFSGRDLSNLCQEAITNMVREQNPNLEELTPQQLEKYTLKTRSLNPEDFNTALEKIRPATKPEDLKKFDKWREEFGG